jgi:hypothetical protein
MSQAAIGKRFGITQPTVWAIINKKTWAHVDDSDLIEP